MRTHPHLYEINTWPWLHALSRRAGRHLTLAGVPDGEWDLLERRGIDIVYLMGIWKRSAFGREIARREPSLTGGFDRALPGWTDRDVVGSAYCIAEYEPDPRIGTWEELASVRRRLHARGMQLMVDYIPNHTGFDHPWIHSHPDRYVQGDEAAFRRNPGAFRAVDTAAGVRFLACARDPGFPPWTDVAQLDYSSADTRAAMTGVLGLLAQHADGARCDMAMLVLSEVFVRTWKDYIRAPMPPGEFWTDARSAAPAFTLLAEVYWDLEWRLQQLGFDFTYDKRLYDRLLHSTASEVRAHLVADEPYQRRLARFVENHDEPRSPVAFGDRVAAAAVASTTIPGLRFFYQGQFEGRTDRLPVQLGRWADQPVNTDLSGFYDTLLGALSDDVFHVGEWRLLDVRPAGDGSSGDLLAWRWQGGGDLRIVVVNLGGARSQGAVHLSSDVPGDAQRDDIVFEDQLDGRRYERSRSTLKHSGLHVTLDKGAAHLLRLSPRTG